MSSLASPEYTVLLERERKPNSLGLTRQGNSYNCTGTGIEDILTQDKDWAPTRLVMSANGIEIGPINVAS
jgi:hypothetical protein